jgi:hypothetical protein
MVLQTRLFSWLKIGVAITAAPFRVREIREYLSRGCAESLVRDNAADQLRMRLRRKDLHFKSVSDFRELREGGLEVSIGDRTQPPLRLGARLCAGALALDTRHHGSVQRCPIFIRFLRPQMNASKQSSQLTRRQCFFREPIV